MEQQQQQQQPRTRAEKQGWLGGKTGQAKSAYRVDECNHGGEQEEEEDGGAAIHLSKHTLEQRSGLARGE